MFIILAWRNIWRSKSSTRITMILTIWATLILATFISLLNGTFDKQYDDTINLYPGYIHIENPSYVEDPNYDNLMYDTASIQKKLEHFSDIKLYTTRLESFFLFSSKDNSFGGMLVGVEPSSEQKMSRMHRQVIKGRFLNDLDTNGVIIGKTMAEKLHIDIGDEFSIVGNAIDNSFAADNLKVIGIIYTGVEGYDAQFAMINKNYLDTLMNSQNIASHIIVKPKNVDDSEEIARELNKGIQTNIVTAIDWHIHMKTVIDSLLLIKVSRYLIIVFVLAIIFSVVAIFALITLFARTHEIGVMRALGTKPSEIVKIILLERFFLTLIAITIGGVLAIGLALLIEVYPIRFGLATEYANSIGFMDLVLITKFSFQTIFIAQAYILLFSFVSVFYPLWHISRLKPLEAMNN